VARYFLARLIVFMVVFAILFGLSSLFGLIPD
jgi:hypothetical protein